MNQEVILAMIAMISGGGLTAVLKIIVDHTKSNREQREKDVDERIAIWQKISEKNETRLELMERKLEIYEADFRSIELYILALEHVIVHAIPPLQLPQRPTLRRDELTKGGLDRE